MLNEKQIEILWESGNYYRNQASRCKLYYDGKAYPEGLKSLRRDSRPKSYANTNWTRYIVQQHVGFLTNKDISYTTRLDDTSGIQYLYQVYRDNKLNAMDAEHLTNAMLYGQSIEIHSIKDDFSHRIDIGNPLNFVFLENERGDTIAALSKVIIPKASYYAGNFLEKEKEIYTIYDANNIIVYEKDSKGLVLLESKEHQLGRLPIVRFGIAKDYQSFFKDEFFRACDNYNEIRSSLLDDIKYNVDSLVKFIGVDPAALTEIDKESGLSSFEHFKLLGAIFLKQGEDAQYLSRQIDINKFQFDLKVSRNEIHIMGCIPDINDNVNSSSLTNISGEALKIMYQAMIQKASEFIKYFESGLHDRISLINASSSIFGNAIICDYDINISMNIPKNNLEWLQNASNLATIIPRAELYKLFPFIENPENTYMEYLAEKGINPKSNVS